MNAAGLGEEIPIRVGIIGLQPGRSWAAVTHLPALRRLSQFDVVGVANSSAASSEAAAAATGIRGAFSSTSELITSPDVDVVVITVKVPHHLELVRAALAARKHVYCEWPLGNGLAEAEEMARLAADTGLVAVAGMQARVAPEVMHLRDLVNEGVLGEVLSTTITGWGNGWGPSIEIEKVHSYLLDKRNGASMLTIPIGHTLAAVREALGPFQSLSAILDNRRTFATARDTGATVPMTSHDQVLLSGVLASGVPISLHYRGGTPRYAPGMVWEVNGTEGDARISGKIGHAQIPPLVLQIATNESRHFQAIDTPARYLEGVESGPRSNVMRVYARMASDIREATRTAPSFADAAELHRVLDAVERSADSGERLVLS